MRGRARKCPTCRHGGSGSDVRWRSRRGSGTLIIGNGDVRDIAHARELAAETGADGVMLGRAIFGNPFLFSERKDVSLEEKLRVMVGHTKLYEELFSGVKGFDSMRKHYVAYVSGFPRAKELRVKLMSAKNAAEVEKTTSDFLGECA
jgi:tRNA-dihydrouridine synthase